MNIRKFAVDGMHCQSCELMIERRLKKLPNVRQVDVNAAKGVARVVCEGEPPTIEALNAAVIEDGYKVRPLSEGARPQPIVIEKRPTFWQLVGLFGMVLLLGSLLTRLGLFKTNAVFDSSTTFWTVFVVGLIAASSSCIAVSGGLLLSSAAKFNERFGSDAPLTRMRPVFMFIAGRVLSYTVLGGVIGAIGKALTPPLFVTGAITVLAALYMLVMGLDMLHIAPAWLKGLLPRMPKALSHRIMDAQGHPHPVAPFVLGAATFFLPCGFTQALQLYAFTTGNFAQSALLMMAFALGTAPALLALGWASGSLKGAAGKFFFRFSGALVVVLGLLNIQHGMTLAGFPLRLPDFSSTAAAAANAADPNVKLVDGKQVIRMRLGTSDFYDPSDAYTVKAGTPVRMEIEGPGYGCRSMLVIPRLRKSVALRDSLNILEFTPDAPGTYTFSCAMGMYPGTLTVVPNA